MDLIERLRERVRTLKFGDHTYSLTVAANDPLRLEAAAELERLTADNAALRADAARWREYARLARADSALPTLITLLDRNINDSARAKESGSVDPTKVAVA